MTRFSSYDDRNALEAAMPYEARDLPVTLYGFLARTAERYPDRPAISFQLLADPKSHASTLTWQDLLERVTETANLFRKLGVGPTDTVA